MATVTISPDCTLRVDVRSAPSSVEAGAVGRLEDEQRTLARRILGVPPVAKATE